MARSNTSIKDAIELLLKQTEVGKLEWRPSLSNWQTSRHGCTVTVYSDNSTISLMILRGTYAESVDSTSTPEVKALIDLLHQKYPLPKPSTETVAEEIIKCFGDG